MPVSIKRILRETKRMSDPAKGETGAFPIDIPLDEQVVEVIFTNERGGEWGATASVKDLKRVFGVKSTEGYAEAMMANQEKVV